MHANMSDFTLMCSMRIHTLGISNECKFIRSHIKGLCQMDFLMVLCFIDDNRLLMYCIIYVQVFIMVSTLYQSLTYYATQRSYKEGIFISNNFAVTHGVNLSPNFHFLIWLGKLYLAACDALSYVNLHHVRPCPFLCYREYVAR